MGRSRIQATDPPGSVDGSHEQGDAAGLLRDGQLLASLPAAVYTCDTDGRLTMYNRAAEELWGRAPTIGRDLWCGSLRIYRPDGTPVPLDECPMALTLKTGRSFDSEEVVIERADGTRRHVLVNPRPLVDGAGKVVGAVNMLLDVTERKRAEDALRDSEERFRTLAMNAPVAIFIKDLDGRYTLANPLARQVLGRDDVIGKTDADLLPAEIAAVLRENDLKVFRSGKGLETEVVVTPTGRSRREFLSVKFPLCNSAGEIEGVCGVAVEVTERNEAERALRASELRFRGMADAAPAKLWVTDRTGACTFFSHRWYEKTGQSEQSALGWGWLDAVHPEDRRTVRTALLEATRRMKPFSIDYRFRRADGAWRWGAASARPRFDGAGTFEGFVGSVVDVTDRKEVEHALQQANEDLEDRVAERTAQLRALARELTQTEQRERKRLARSMHDEIQQLLAVAKMQASLAIDRPRETDAMRQLVRVIDEAIAACRTLTVNLSPPVLRDGDLYTALQWLSRHMDEQHGLAVMVDEAPQRMDPPEDLRTLLFEITRELLFNVVKHADRKEAIVRLGRAGRFVYVEVADRGEGCDPELLRRPKPDSFGLFSIRERLADLGGRMEVDAALGAGCRVRVLVPHADALDVDCDADADRRPVSVAAPDVETDVDDEPIAGVIRVVLADDHQILRQGLVELLSSQADTRVIGEAANGAEAVELARRLKPDVVVMDINMPVMGGIEATRVIRSELPHVRVVGLSMHDAGDVGEAIIDAGAEAFVNKCGPGSELLNALRRRA